MNLTTEEWLNLQRIFEGCEDRDADHVSFSRIPEFVYLIERFNNINNLIEEFVTVSSGSKS